MILKGLRILDFTRVLAGPYASMLLADFGAEVIKVQSRKTATGVELNSTGYFNTWNRNKKSITLNMDYQEARNIALKLTAISDVVIENFSSRVMMNWGLEFKDLKKVKPDLIMLSMSGMGRDGPYENYVAYGPTVQSLGGITYLTSYNKNNPMGLGYSYADHIAGLYGVLAILSALEFRDKTGEGQHIDLSEFEAVTTLIGPRIVYESANDNITDHNINDTQNFHSAPYGIYRCMGNDRWCVIAIYNDEEWRSLCAIMNKPDLIKNKKFSSFTMREKHKIELDDIIEKWTSDRSAEEIVESLQEGGVSAGIVQNAEDISRDPHLHSRDFFIHLEHPVLGDTISIKTPIRFKSDPAEYWTSAPLLGEDNRYVFMELLGYTESQIKSYIEKGIID